MKELPEYKRLSPAYDGLEGSDIVRPEKAYYLISNAIKDRNLYNPEVLRACHKLYSKCEMDERDYRTGEETYGYNNNESNLNYISDRFYCMFRLTWLIDGIEGGKF